MIYEKYLKVAVGRHGYPPQDPQSIDLYIRWHANILETSLRIARRLQIKMDGKSQLAEDTSMAESYPPGPSSNIQHPATFIPPQIAMPTDDASHETGTMMPQQPTTMQLSGQSHPGFYSPSQSEIYSITSSSSDNTFGHPMYPDSNRRLQYTFGPDQRYSGGYTLDPTLTDNTDALWDISDMMPQEPGP